VDRPRVLFVSPRLPQPLNSGTNIRICHLLQGIAETCEVHWLGYGSTAELEEFRQSATDSEPWWTRCRSMRALPMPRWPAARLEVLEQLACRRPLAASSLYVADFPAEPLRSLCRQMVERVDLVWVERLHLAQGLGLPARKCVVDLDDLESVKIERRAEVADGRYVRWALRREADRLAALESAAPATYAGVAVCSEMDSARWPNHEGIWVVPNGADDRLFLREPIPRIPGRIVFVGTLAYWANLDAIRYFMQDIFPALRRRIPRVSLAIVGRDPPDEIRRLHDGETVLVHGDVPDVAPFVQEAELSIVPLRAGGGTRLKILESLALGTAVVSTTIGAEGLELRDGEELALADGAGAFAEAVARLLENGDLRDDLLHRGRQRTSELYRWSGISSRLGERVGRLAQSLRRGGARERASPG
jgi:glycosyltransferase involved in cell wall biosynthesis